jgi:diacylglycerol O-acyltransferase
MGTFMTDTDAFTWYMERDPALRSTIVSVAWLEQSPDWDALVGNLERATRLVPIFRQRVIEPPARLSTPRWTVDDRFDLTWHFRRIDAPAPHTPETVVTFARNAAMTAFDHTRPLWEFTLVEGLAGERAALVMKVHHALTDGIGGMDLALHLFDIDRAPRAPAAEPDPPPGEQIGTGELVRAGLARDWNRTLGFVRDTTGSLVPAAARAARHPVASVAEGFETVRSIGRTVAPVTETLSPIMKERSTARQFGMIEVQLGDLKDAAVRAGGSVNDGFMASVAGGFRRYHERHDASVDALRVTLPISIRKPDDPPGGNHITLMRFAVPVSDADPASRIREMGRLCHAARDERSLAFVNLIAATLNLLPRAAVAGMLKHVDFVASDIPGYAFPIFLAGSQVERIVAFGPTIGAAANLSLLSYNGTCCIGVSIDTAAVADPDVLIECLREGFEEVLTLGGAHEPARLPLRDGASTHERESTDRNSRDEVAEHT